MSSTKLLQPEVWSKILSFLPPDELGSASEVLFSPRKPSATYASASAADVDRNIVATIQEAASRMAVESMIRTAVQHFSKHMEEGDNDDGQPGPSSLEVEELLSSNRDVGIDGDCDGDCVDGTQVMTSESRRQQFARYKDQTWPSLYAELYMVYEFLLPGFGKDRSEAIAHAVHSLYLLSGQDEF